MIVEYRRPWLADYQLDAIFCEERYGLIEATTKSGKTVGCELWLLELAMQGRDGWPYLWLAPSHNQASVAYDGEEGMKRWIVRSSLAHHCRTNDTNKTITLPNGAIIWFKTGEDPDAIYAPGYYGVVIDEASRVREEAWHAVRTTITKTRAPVRMIGNVKGRKNWFYQLCRKAEAGEPDHHYAKITWHDAVDAGILDREEIEEARRDLPEAVFRELYEAEPSDDEGNPFGITHIRHCCDAYEKPYKSNPVSWGWDLARAVDWCVGIALDAQGRVCEFHRFQKPWKETYRTIWDVTGDVPALVDATSMGGDMAVERLQREQGEHSNFQPYVFTPKSKQELMEGLAVAIQHHEISFPDGPIRTELEAFEYEYTRGGVRYSAPDGMHDDCVDALALAVMGWRGMVAAPAYEDVHEPAVMGQFEL